MSALFAAASIFILTGLWLLRDWRCAGLGSKLLVLGASAMASFVACLPDIYFRYLSRGSLISGGWDDYLANRPDANYIGLLLSIPVGVLGLAALSKSVALMARRRFLPPLLMCASALSIVSVFLLFGWVWGVKFFYGRALIFVAAGLVPLVVWAVVRWYATSTWPSFLIFAVLLGPHAGSTVQVSRDFFRYPNEASMQGLEWVREHTAATDVLVVQPCQFAAAPYVARRPTMPALPSVLLSSSSEFGVTQAALRILRGAPGYENDIEANNVRTVLLDRGCHTPGAVASGDRLQHLMALTPPFRPAFDNGDVIVFHRD